MKLNNPFSSRNIIWYVSEVSAWEIKIHFPDSSHLNRFYNHWKTYHWWLVWSYVVIEWETKWFLWKFMKVSLPEKERKDLTEEKYKNLDFHPVWYIELLFSFDLITFEPEKSINNFPSVWSKVYVTDSEFYISILNKDKENDEFEWDKISIWEDLSTWDKIELSANKIFQRHCAIVWTTWWWKSYTVSKIIEELIQKEWAKILLLDPTWEFESLDWIEINGEKMVESYKFNKGVDDKIDEIIFNYTNLNFDDIVAFLRPWWQSQLPIIEESLKILSSLDKLKIKYADTSFLVKDIEWEKEYLCFKKEKQLKKDFISIISEANIWIYDINNLSIQMWYSCVHENDFTDIMKFWWKEEKTIWYIQSAIFRLRWLLSSDSANKIFNFSWWWKDSQNCIENRFIEFYWNGKKRLLRLDLSGIPDELRIREILVNAIWKNLLIRAKKWEFKYKPLIVFLDEAHLFLWKIIKDEHSIDIELNAFERIAKECRKYWLYLCLSTQRPRDIPEWILSQMWTFIVHRLINDKDKSAIENAVSNYNKSFLSFLPSLWKWEALIMWVEFLTTLFLKIQKTVNPPNSDTPPLFWKKN